MALEWKWEHQSGELTFEGKTYPWYEGNAYMIVLNEYKDKNGQDMYTMMWFFVDKEHMKNSLGLKKGYIDMFEGNVEKLTIYKEHCRNWKDIADAFSKSQKNCVIEIRKRKEVA